MRTFDRVVRMAHEDTRVGRTELLTSIQRTFESGFVPEHDCTSSRQCSFRPCPPPAKGVQDRDEIDGFSFRCLKEGFLRRNIGLRFVLGEQALAHGGKGKLVTKSSKELVMMEDKLAFICGGIASQARRKLRDGGCFGLPPNRGRVRPRTATVVAVFDFLKQGQKAVEESGQSIVDYVKKRAEEDIAKVNAFNDGLQKSRERLAQDLSAILGSITTDAELEEALENLEEVLITSDLGMDTVDIVMDDLRAEATKEKLRTEEDVKATLKGTLVRVLNEKGGSAPLSVGSEAPTVVVFVGANGMGKTTTVGKLAMRYKKEGKKVLLAACDTFRAAAVEQLATWADRAEVDIVKPLEGAKNPSSTAFRAVKKGQEEGYDVVIIDTSGRLHTNHNLMGELRKLVSVVKKFKEGGADETLLVVDASIGRNAMSQAVNFREEIGLTGLAVTKLDGTARAGFVVSVVNDLQLPIKLVGVGEKVEDLRDFEPEFFVEGLVG